MTNPAPAQPAVFELVSGNDPYFNNFANPGDPAYLSQDLRVFTITPDLSQINPTTNQPFPQLGDPSITATLTTESPAAYDPIAPFNYITQLLTQLNTSSTYTSPMQPGQSDPLDKLLPDQANALQDFSSLTPSTIDSNDTGYLNYNFAIARVRLYEAQGDTTDTPVRVFFRLFTTLSFDTQYDATPASGGNLGGTYSSVPDAKGLPLQPLPGSDGNIIDGTTIDTIPFYATGNYEVVPVQHDYDVSGLPSPSTVNSQLITNPSGSNSDQLYRYYGCYLNVYDPNITVNKYPIQALLPGAHHCVVAQIACDDSPIPTNANPALSPQNSDKLAQRNTNITWSDNPGPIAGHRIPQTFDTVLTPAYTEPSGPLLNYQSEMMIEWGNHHEIIHLTIP